MMVQVVKDEEDDRRVRRRTSQDQDDSDNSEVRHMVYSFDFLACSPFSVLRNPDPLDVNCMFFGCSRKKKYFGTKERGRS